MLYLPPAYAHDGVAIDACTTYSIGFARRRTPSLRSSFLDYVRDRIELPGRYEDRGLVMSSEPARVPAAMQRHAARELRKIRWSAPVVAQFLGASLSEPKPTVFFQRPREPLTLRAFGSAIKSGGVRLDRQTLWLYDDRALYVNGQTRPGRAVTAPASRRSPMRGC
jgi:50S ribosomal protein L16 3-hydroxylase